MKKVFIIIMLCMLLISCTKESELLAYQEGDFTAICQVNNEYTIQINKQGDDRILSILQPSSLDSIQFIINKEECMAIYGGNKIPLERERMVGVIALCSIFDMSNDGIVSSSINGNDACIYFERNGVKYAITYNESNLPRHVQISTDSFCHEVDILELKRAN